MAAPKKSVAKSSVDKKDEKAVAEGPAEAKESKRDDKKKKQPPGFAKADQYMTILSASDMGETPTMSTGVPGLDQVLGGGLPLGMMTEIFGLDKAGKSLLSTRLCREALSTEDDAWVLYLDAERTLVPSLMGLNGLTPELRKRIMVARTNVAEVVIGMMGAALTGTVPDDMPGKDTLTGIDWRKPPALIIWDSVAQTIAITESEEAATDKMGYPMLPRIIGKRMPPITAYMEVTGCPLVCCNQMRENLDPMSHTKYDTPGGRWLKHAFATRLEIRRSTDKSSGDTVGVHTVEVKKSKLTGDGLSTTFRFSRSVGLHIADALVEEVAVPLGIVEKGGSGWYTWGDIKFQLKNIEEKLGSRLPELVEACRSISGVPNLGGAACDDWCAGKAVEPSTDYAEEED